MSTSQTLSTSSPAARLHGLPDIALVGRAGAGKTTAAQMLCDLGVLVGDRAVRYGRMSFAEPLKEIAVQLWGSAAYNDRRKLQRLGVAVREIEADTWLDAFEREYHRIHDARVEPPIVVDDCRFPNEYYRLKALGFVVVRISAGQLQRVERLQANGKFQSFEQLSHVSETALDDVDADYTILNDGDIMDLYADLAKVVAREARRS